MPSAGRRVIAVVPVLARLVPAAAQARPIDAVPSAAGSSATLQSVNNTYTSQTFPLDFTGSQRLYLVFRSVTGGPTAGLGNLNWVEFSGSGAGVNP